MAAGPPGGPGVLPPTPAIGPRASASRTYDPSRVSAGITYDGYDRILAGVAAGQGTIMALPHLGGWEWAGTHLASIGHPLSVLVERLEPPDVFEWFVS